MDIGDARSHTAARSQTAERGKIRDDDPFRPGAARSKIMQIDAKRWRRAVLGGSERVRIDSIAGGPGLGHSAPRSRRRFES